MQNIAYYPPVLADAFVKVELTAVNVGILRVFPVTVDGVFTRLVGGVEYRNGAFAGLERLADRWTVRMSESIAGIDELDFMTVRSLAIHVSMMAREFGSPKPKPPSLEKLIAAGVVSNRSRMDPLGLVDEPNVFLKRCITAWHWPDGHQTYRASTPDGRTVPVRYDIGANGEGVFRTIASGYDAAVSIAEMREVSASLEVVRSSTETFDSLVTAFRFRDGGIPVILGADPFVLPNMRAVAAWARIASEGLPQRDLSEVSSKRS